jgi:predicted O-methyltransferase YrrM
MLPSDSDLDMWVQNPSDLIRKARQISMLGEAALALLENFARYAEGPVIELGPYIGGSTLPLASGTRNSVISVEIGGTNLGHEITSPDIIGDLGRNLESAGLRRKVSIIEGHFRSVDVFARVQRELAGAEAGLLFVDVDPGTEVAIGLYAQLVRDDAFVIVDDYRSSIASDKARSVSTFVDLAVRQGILDELGVFGWGTWFGKLRGAQARHDLLSLRSAVPCVHEQGHCWVAYVGYASLGDDRTGNSSPLRLLENGLELGPAHTMHAAIREQGAGRFSHWGGELYFSSSDNSNPQLNGRRYSITLGERETDLSSPTPLPNGR